MDLLVIIMLCHVVVAFYTYFAICKGHKKGVREKALSNWHKERFEIEEAKQSHEPISHKIAFELGEALIELPNEMKFQKIKSDIHPAAMEYYRRSKGENVKRAEIRERPSLKLVK